MNCCKIPIQRTVAVYFDTKICEEGNLLNFLAIHGDVHVYTVMVIRSKHN